MPNVAAYERRLSLRNSSARVRRDRPIRGIRGPRRAESEYRAWLFGIIRAIEGDLKREVYPILNQSGLALDSPVDDLKNAIDYLARKYSNAAKFYENNAEKFVTSVSERNKRSFERAIPSGIGVDLSRIIHGTGSEEVLKGAVNMNVSLIKTIPEEFFSKIERAIWVEVTGSQPNRKSLIDKIRKIGGVSRNRAVVIARDQTSKLNSALTIVRARDIGSEEYIWRSVQDDRVVGNPSGLYPKGNLIHGNHYKRNGKRYRFDSPPSDGHPGEPIGCRCWMEPVVVI